jgi:hypothetical protein
MSWWRKSRSVPAAASVEPGGNDVAAASLADAVRAHAPLPIVTASFDGYFLLSIDGGDWRMGATAPWRVCRGGEVVFGSGTAGAAWLVDSLVGHAVVAVRSRSSLTDVDPLFELTGGLTLEVFSTVHLDPWVMLLDGSSTWVGDGERAMFGPGRRSGLPDPDAVEDGIVEAVRADGGLLRLTTGTRSWLFGRSWRVLVDRIVYVSDEDLEPEERLRSTLGLAVSGYGRPSPLTEDRWLRLGADVVVEAFDDGRAAAVDADLRYCRVCGLRHESPPWGLDGASPTYGFCACCGVQFGYEDLTPDAVEGYRQWWACSGARWHQAGLRPSGWSAEEQRRAIPAPFVARSDRQPAAVEGGVLLAALQAFCRRAGGVTVRLPSGWFGRPYDNRHAMTNGYVEDGRAIVEFDRRFTLAVGGATVLTVSGGVLRLEGFTSAAWVQWIRAGEAPRGERFDGGGIELHG